jgi:outer membrane protein assembly factor BamA
MNLKFKMMLACLLFLLFGNSVFAQYSILIKEKDSSVQQKINYKSRADQQSAIAKLVDSKIFAGNRLLKVENDTAQKTESVLFFSIAPNFVIHSVRYADSIRVNGNKMAITPLVGAKRYSYAEYVKKTNRIVADNEEKGFPFVMVTPTFDLHDDSTVFVNLFIDQGFMIHYDSVDVKGSSKISRRFLATYLGVKKGEVYNEKKLREIEKRLMKLPYLQSVKSPEIAFIDSNMRLILYLNKKNSSQFDGIVGILPASDGESKTLITGEIKLNLQNSFSQGEQLSFNWKRNVPLSQDLLITAMFPYVFGSKYGGNGSFKLQKKDTTSMTNTFKVGGQLYLSGLNYMSVYFENSTSKLLSTSTILSLGRLNDQIDYSAIRYGVATEIDLLNDIYIPTKGVKVGLDGNIGTRKLIQNANVPVEYYKNITASENQVKINSSVDTYYPILSKLILNVSGKLNYLSGSSHFENEMFKIGGLTSLRGFNEESITATFVSILNTEIRWMIDRRTFVYTFWNGAYYEKRTLQKFVHDTPNGFGMGLSFDTPAGIFNITYALGKEFNNPIQLKYGKVHFGIVARF